MAKPQSITPFLFLLAIAFSVAGCEGFKVLTLYNKSGKEITVETRPELPRFKHTTWPDTAQYLSADKTYRLLPDSSLLLLATFGGGVLFHGKIREQDLAIDYLRLVTPTETFVANNRKEIIELIKNPALKHTQKDTGFVLDNNKNLEAIIVRQ